MDKFQIYGGARLDGEIDVYSAKNSVLALLAASILTDEQVILTDCPKIGDVYNMIKILEALGSKVVWQENSIIIDSSGAYSHEIPQSYGKEIRSSIFMLGSILARFKKAKAVFPGGCDIGLRPIDLHIKGLRELNIDVKEMGANILCDAKNARGKKIHLDFPSVGATENIMLASVLINGRTVICNAAKEPEIVCLQDMLNKMGAKVYGAGTGTIEIEGVKKLHGVEFKPIPDRIVAGTYLIAAAMTKGKVYIKNCRPNDLTALISKLNGVSCDILANDDTILVKGYEKPQSVMMIETSPYPGFPTDLQAQTLALQTISHGTSLIVENIFETRYKHVGELIKMGAEIVVKDRCAIVRGVEKLYGTQVFAHDLRGGAALVLAGLAAEGTTTVEDIHHVDRGYYKLEEDLTSLGASVKRIQS